MMYSRLSLSQAVMSQTYTLVTQKKDSIGLVMYICSLNFSFVDFKLPLSRI